MNAGADRLRPAWTTLPESLRTRIVSAIGGDFVKDDATHGGFSASYAGVVTTTAGRAFVKACAAGWHADSLHFLREEMRTLARLPSTIAPRLHVSIDDDEGAAIVGRRSTGIIPDSPGPSTTCTPWREPCERCRRPPRRRRCLARKRE